MRRIDIDGGNFTTHWRFGMDSEQVTRWRDNLIQALRRHRLDDESRGRILGQLEMLDRMRGLPDLLFPAESSTHASDDNHNPLRQARRIPLSSR